MSNTMCIMMLAMTRAGKTTKVATLSALPKIVSKVCIKKDATTPVTTDWEFTLTANDIRLTKVELNPKAIYKDVYSRTIVKYNENLEENPMLTRIFGFEKLPEATANTDPKNYVEQQLQAFVENATFETIEKLMSAKEISRYVKRITIQLPPSEEFKETLEALDLHSMTLRDTRGIMDVNPEDLEKMPMMSMYDLGLDGIDAVLLLCSEQEYPAQAVKWYKDIYKDCFQAVPVFLEGRSGALYSTYLTYSDITEITPEEYLDKVKENKIKSLDEAKKASFESGFNLLRSYGAADYCWGKWSFNYKVFEMEDCLYLTPVVLSLKTAARDGHISDDVFDNDSYRFFRSATLYNMHNIAKRVKEHLDLTARISNCGFFDNALVAQMTQDYASEEVHMYPEYRYISRQAVCNDIVHTEDFLGPREGITTQNHGEPKYLAAATSATTSYRAISSGINWLKLTDTVKDANGEEIAPDVSLERQQALVQMHLHKKLKNSADIYAHFKGYMITNRNIVVDAMCLNRKHRAYAPGKDALNIVTLEIARQIFM